MRDVVDRLRVVALLITCLFLAPAGVRAESPAGLHLAAFSADVSPPLGQEHVCVGFIPKFTEIERPLLAKGVVLKDAGGVYVLCALDFLGTCNESYDLFRARLAKAAGTTPDRVAVHCLHQHTAPCFDASTARLAFRDDPKALATHLEAAGRAADKVADAVRVAVKSYRLVTHVAAGKAQVDRVAGNRRLPLPDGSIGIRWSFTKDPALRSAPEGLIDPWVRTVAFYDGARPLARLHYYATHPQTRSDGRTTYDVPGLARERLQQETGVFQVYFTGCSGNVTLGKYNDGTPAGRAALAERLYDGMKAAAATEEKQPVTQVHWTARRLDLPLRDDAGYSPAAARKVFDNPKAHPRDRFKAATLLAWAERVQAGKLPEVDCLSLGTVRLVHLPGEPFIQFQLAAHKARPDRFVAVAGYGDCAPWYIGEDRIYTDRGGYEQTWSFVGPCEKVLYQTIRDVLADRR